MTHRVVRHLAGALSRLSALFFFSVILMLSGAYAQTPASSAPPSNRPPSPAVADPDANDPDLPAFAHGSSSIDKATYLLLRAEHIGRLRGLDTLKDRTARGKAIQQMRRQEIQRDARIAAAARGAASTGSASAPISFNAASPQWQPIGPAPIPNGQTTPTEVPVSGRVTAIAVHPTTPNTVYIGAAQGGVWRSTDGGTSWTPLMDAAQSLSIGAIAIAPSQPSTIFVGTGEPNFALDSFFGVGVYRIDNADTANPTLVGPLNSDGVNDVFTGRSISKILVDPTDANTIFVSTTSGFSGLSSSIGPTPLPNRGVYRSSNALSSSVTFSMLTGLAGGLNRAVADMVFEPGTPNNLTVIVVDTGLLPANGGIYHSTNALASPPGNVAFTNPVVTPTGVSVGNGRLAINKVGSTVTLVAATGEGSGMLRISTDGGVNWSGLSGGGGFCSGQCFYDIAVALDPANANRIYLGGSTNPMFAISANGGTSFANSQNNLHADTHAITIAPSSSSTIYEGNDGGIFKSLDSGATWSSLNQGGLSITQFQSLALHPSDRQFMIGGTQDNGTPFRHPDGSWIRADFGDGGYSEIDNNAADTTNVTMYHTYFNATGRLIGFGRVTSVANAQEGFWTSFGCGFTNPGIPCTDPVLFYAPMALGPGNPNTLYFGTDRLYRSPDRGTTMTVVSQTPFATGQDVSAIGISPQSDNVRIVGLTNGKVFATAGGANPLIDVTGASFPVNYYVARAVVDPNNSSTAFITFDGYGLAAGAHVWKTTNLNLSDTAGTTWAASGNGIPDVPVNAFVVDPQNSNVFYAGTDIGVYNSTDGGATWNPFGSGLPRVAVFDMALENANRVLRVATHGRGIWEISFAQPTHFQVAAPASSPAGTPFSVTVTALDVNNIAVTNYTGTIHFTSTDPRATLPANYTFVAADNGVHTFSGIALGTLGSQTITATDTVTASLTGTATINVTPGPASHFTVAANPTSTVAGTAVSVTVTALDTFNNQATGYLGTVHFTSSDIQAALPGNYSFVAGDNGAHSFPVTLKTAGNQSISVQDTVTASISGSTTVLVTAAPATHYSITVPPTVTAGTAFTVRLVAQDPFNNTDHSYIGTVHFTSSDVAVGVVLPADYTFVPADNGIKLFTNGFKLQTVGTQSITATDTVTASITATVSTQVVTDLPLTGVPRTIRMRSGRIPVVVATFTDADGTASTGSFTVSIDWGDSTGPDNSAVITQPGGPGTTFIVTGKHFYGRKSIFPVKVTVTDVAGGFILNINSTASFFPRTFSF